MVFERRDSQMYKEVVCGIPNSLPKILFTVGIYRVSLHVGII